MLVLNDNVVDDIDVLVLIVLRVYVVWGVKSLMSSIISSTSFFFALLHEQLLKLLHDAFSMINYSCESLMSLSSHYLLNIL